MSDTINDNMGEIADEMGIPAYQQFFFNDRLLGKENTITSPEIRPLYWLSKDTIATTCIFT